VDVFLLWGWAQDGGRLSGSGSLLGQFTAGIIARRSTGGLLEFTHHPEEKTMQLSSESFKDGAVIPGEFAFCVPAREGHVALSTNLNPQLAWAGAPPAPSRLR
jgi:hypothetical protein